MYSASNQGAVVPQEDLWSRGSDWRKYRIARPDRAALEVSWSWGGRKAHLQAGRETARQVQHC